jgi:hypothetical protein
VDYWTDVLPGVLLFALGLSATVAPLTNTVLGAVPQHNAGVASGVNNQVARVASLLAIAVVGAVVAARFGGVLDDRVAGTPLAGDPAVEEVNPLSGGVRGRPELDAAVEAASVSAYRAGLGLAGGLVILGGMTSLLGIVNPQRGVRREELGAVRMAQPCPDCREQQPEAA